MQRRQHNESGLIGWEAELSDGTVVKESDGTSWSSVKNKATSLSLSSCGIRVSLPNKQKSYVQGKSASSSIVGGNFQIESRWIGFVVQENKTLFSTIMRLFGHRTVKNKTVLVRIFEKTGEVKVEIS